ncbi:MAG: C39 family peptidase [Deltaproteobacteria bacterium]|nr:C39 family peptidase [Deltaproteobacteria bacterium]
MNAALAIAAPLSPEFHARIEAMLDAGRALDAFACTKTWWQQPPRSHVHLGLDETLLALRLSARLGGRFEGALLRHAERTAPTHPMVVLRRRIRVAEVGLYRAVLDYERAPEIDGATDEVASWWYAHQAVVRGTLRDFDTAWALLQRAGASLDDGYVASSRAQVLLQQHRFDEAVDAAERAWAQSPGLVAAGFSLAGAQAAVDRGEAAAEQLLAWIDGGGQSHEILLLALALRLATARHAEPDEAQALARDILRRAASLEALAPLAVPAVHRGFAALRVEAARVAGDLETMRQQADLANSSFHRTLAERLREPGTDRRRVRLPHPRPRQRLDTCVPASIVTCTGALGQAIDMDSIAAEITYGGTAMWRVRDWATRHHLQARYFAATWESACALLDRGLPFVITFEDAVSGHACAIVGYDAAARTFIGHDPSEGAFECLADAVRSAEAPLGPLACVLVPASRIEEIAALALFDEASTTVAVEIEARLHCDGASAARAYAERDDIRSHVSPATRARLDSCGGRHDLALAAYLELHERHPQNLRLQALLEHEAAYSRDAQLHARILDAILEAPAPAELRSDGGRRRALAIFEVQRAVRLARDASQWSLAEAQLLEAVRRSPHCAAAYAALGDLAWLRGRSTEALLPLRLAAALQPTNPAYAERYAWALQRSGRIDTAVAWLGARAVELAHEAGDASPVMGAVVALRELGEPTRAIETLLAARRDHPRHGALAAEAAVFLAEFGRDEDAARALADARAHADAADELRAATLVAQLGGRVQHVIHLCEAWVEEAASDLHPRSLLLEALAQTRGRAAAVARARAWLDDAPRDAGLERLLLAQLDASGSYREHRARLVDRIERDPADVWAAHALAEALWRDISRGGRGYDPRLPELQAAVQRCIALAPTHEATHAIDAELALLRGDPNAAAACLDRAIAAAPAVPHHWRRRLELAAQLGATQLDAIETMLDAAIAGGEPGIEAVPPAVIVAIAEAGGLARARAALDRWEPGRPGAPCLLEARIDLELTCGDEAALAGLREPAETMTARHPLHRGLRLSQQALLERLGCADEACDVAIALCRDLRGDAGVRATAAMRLTRFGRPAAAVELLDEALALAPFAPALAIARARLAWDDGEHDASLAILEAACARMPTAADLLETRGHLLVDRGRPDQALTLLAQACAAYPELPALAHARISILRRPELNTSMREIQRLLDLAASHAPGDWELALERIALARTRGDATTALAIVAAIEPLLEDGVLARGEHAAILHWAGDTDGAIAAMQHVVAARPDYAFGWSALLHWTTQEGAWTLAWEYCEGLPPALREAPAFAMQRVRVADQIEALRERASLELQALVERCPDDLTVRAFAFDMAMRADEHDRARAVLRAADLAELPEALLARAVALELACGRIEAAGDTTRELWGRPHLDPTHAARAVAAHVDAGRLTKLTHAVVRALAAGNGVAPAFAIALIDALDERGNSAGARRLFAAVSPAGAGCSEHVLARLIEVLADAALWGVLDPWMDTESTRLRAAPATWAAVGYALLKQGEYARARDWLADWRTRASATAASINNFAVCALATGHYELAYAAAHFALVEHAAPGCRDQLLRTMLRSSIGAHRPDRFIEDVRCHGLPAHGHGVRALQLLAELLIEQPRGRALVRLCQRFDREAEESAVWMRRRWHELTSPHLRWYERAWLAIT